MSGITRRVTLASPDGLPDRSKKASASASRLASLAAAPATTTAAFWYGVSVTLTSGEPVAGDGAGSAPSRSTPAPPSPQAKRSRSVLVSLVSMCSSNLTASVPPPSSSTCDPASGAGGLVSGVTSTGAARNAANLLNAKSSMAPPPMSSATCAPPGDPAAARYAAVMLAFWDGVSVIFVELESCAADVAPTRPRRPAGGCAPDVPAMAVRFISDRSTRAPTGSENRSSSVPSLRSREGGFDRAGRSMSLVTANTAPVTGSMSLPDRSRTAPCFMSRRTSEYVLLTLAMPASWPASRSSMIEVPLGPSTVELPSATFGAPAPAPAPTTSIFDVLTFPASTYSSNVSTSLRAARLSSGSPSRRGGVRSGFTSRGKSSRSGDGFSDRSRKAPASATSRAAPPCRSKMSASAFWAGSSSMFTDSDAPSGSGGTPPAAEPGPSDGSAPASPTRWLSSGPQAISISDVSVSNALAYSLSHTVSVPFPRWSTGGRATSSAGPVSSSVTSVCFETKTLPVPAKSMKASPGTTRLIGSSRTAAAAR